MTSLRAHLRRPGGHGRLSFHPDCPVCRHERLAGEPHPQAIASHRTLAALTAGLLAVSATAPPLAAAAPDVEQAGTASPDTKRGDDPAYRPDTDAGGPTTTAPDTAAAVTPTPAASRPGDSDPPDPEPTKDPAAAVIDSGDGTPDPPASRQTAAAATQTPATAAPPATPRAVPAPAASTLQGTQVISGPHRPSAPRHASRTHQSQQSHSALGGTTDQVPPSVLAADPPRDPMTTQPSAVPQSPTTHHGRAAAGHRLHVVATGESLWRIARDQLVPNATDAQIASEVNRLWQLNRVVIATGNPDLLSVGTKLKLA